jgi:trigger factor
MSLGNVTVKDVGPCKKLLAITVPQSVVQTKIDESYAKLAGSAVISGFRKGHVPRKLLEKRFGEDVLEEVKQAVLGEASEKAIEENGLKPLGQPSFDNVAFELGKDCTFEMTIEIEPTFDLPEYKGLALKRKSAQVGAEDLNRGVEALRMQRARMDLMPAGTAIAAGDLIVCDWSIQAGTETVADQKDAEIMARGKRSAGIEYEKDLADALAGAKFGDSRQVKIKFLDAYPVEKWRGQEGVLTITPKEVRRPVAPELTDEFAKSLDFDSLEDLKKAVERSLSSTKEREVQDDLEQQLFSALLDRAKIELPEGILKAQARSIMMRQNYRLQQRGVPAEEIEKHLEELRNASEEAAARNLRIYFVLDRIADKEKLFVTETEVEARIASMAAAYRTTPQKMRAQIEGDNSLAELRAGMRESRVVEFLLKSAQVADEK